MAGTGAREGGSAPSGRLLVVLLALWVLAATLEVLQTGRDALFPARTISASAPVRSPSAEFNRAIRPNMLAAARTHFGQQPCGHIEDEAPHGDILADE